MDEWAKNISTYTGTTKIWGKNPLQGQTSGWLYYGNDAVSSIWNGWDTFMFFDDFSNDLSSWTIIHDYCEISSGQLYMHYPTGSQDPRIATLANEFPDGDYAVNLDMDLNDAGGNSRGFIIALRHDNNNETHRYLMQGRHDDNALWLYNSWTSVLVASCTWNNDWNEHNYEFRVWGSTGECLIDGEIKIPQTYIGDEASNGNLEIGIWWSNPPDTYIDDVYLRRFRKPDISVSIGAEETSEAPPPAPTRRPNYIIIPQGL